MTKILKLINPEYDNFENEKNRIDKFNAVCFTAGKNSKDSFYNAIIFGVNQKLKLKLTNINVNVNVKSFVYDVNEILREENLLL